MKTTNSDEDIGGVKDFDDSQLGKERVPRGILHNSRMKRIKSCQESAFSLVFLKQGQLVVVQLQRSKKDAEQA